MVLIRIKNYSAFLSNIPPIWHSVFSLTAINMKISRAVYKQSHCCPSFKILFNLCSVCSIKSFQFLIELSISLINKVNISILIMGSSSTVFGSFLNPEKYNAQCLKA